MIVSVVIANHNGTRFLPTCLEALRASVLPPGVELQTVVVDNGSTDGSPELLAGYPWVESVVVREGLGFARANNRARALVRGQVVCFLNNDTAVEPGWLERPLEILRTDPSVAAVGAKLVFMHRYVRLTARLPAGARLFVGRQLFGGPLDSKVHCTGQRTHLHEHDGWWLQDGQHLYVPEPLPGIDAAPARHPVLRCLDLQGAPPGSAARLAWDGGEVQVELLPGIAVVPPYAAVPSRVRLIQNAGSFINAQGDGGDAGCGDEDDGAHYQAEELVPSLCGAALFVRRDALDAAGWFPEAYRMYYEDTDLCVQLRRRGGRLVFCPASRVGHYHTGTSREWSPFFIENVVRSAAVFAVRQGEAPLVRRRLEENGRRLVRGLRALVRAPSRPRSVWAADPELRGALLSIPEVARGLARRDAAWLASPLALPRAPYVAPKES